MFNTTPLHFAGHDKTGLAIFRAKPLTASERIALALAQKVKISYKPDASTRCFAAFAFRLSQEARETVVRVRKDGPDFGPLVDATT